MKKEGIIGILVIVVLLTACTGTIEPQKSVPKNQPLKLQLPQFNQVTKEASPQRQAGPQKETKPLLPSGKQVSIEECLADWTSVLQERSSFIWIQSNHVLLGFAKDYPLEKAKQLVSVHGFKPEVYNPVEVFPEEYWAGYTEEELFGLSHALKVKVLEGNEIRQACEFAQEKDVLSAVPDVHINLFQ